MKRRLPLLALCLSILSGATTLPSQGSETGEPAIPRVIEVQMMDAGGGQWRFQPAEIAVHHGDVVRFIQADIVPHNVQFKKTPEGTRLGTAAMGPFLLAKGEVYEITIDDRFAAGVHEFVCTPHEMMGMAGRLDVQPGT